MKRECTFNVITLTCNINKFVIWNHVKPSWFRNWSMIFARPKKPFVFIFLNKKIHLPWLHRGELIHPTTSIVDLLPMCFVIFLSQMCSFCFVCSIKCCCANASLVVCFCFKSKIAYALYKKPDFCDLLSFIKMNF